MFTPFVYFISQIAVNKLFVNSKGIIIFDTVTFRASANSYIKKIYLNSPNKFAKNQPLIDLYSPEIERNIKFYNSEIATLEKLIHDSKNSEALKLNNYLEMLAKQEKYLQTRYEKLMSYKKAGMISDFQVREAAYDYHEVQRTIEETKAKISTSQQSFEQFLQLHYMSKIRELQNNLVHEKDKEQKLGIKAMHNGYILNSYVQEGEYVLAGYKMMEITYLQNLEIKLYLNPKLLEKLKDQNRIEVRLPDGNYYAAKVISNPTTSASDQSYPYSFTTADKNIIVYAKFNVSIPDKFRVFGLPVTVKIM